MVRAAAIAACVFLYATGCARDDTAPETAQARRRRTVPPMVVPRATADTPDTVYAPAHRLVRSLDPPLPATEPEECAVSDEFRPALGCLESLPLGEAVVPRPGDDVLRVEGNLPRRFWRRPMIIEPRVRGKAISGFKTATAELLEAGFLGFSFETGLPRVDGEGELELQLRGYVVPSAQRDFQTKPIAIEAGDVLAVGLAFHEVGRPFGTGPVRFRVDALLPEGPYGLFEESLDPKHWTGQWLDRRIDLSSLAGQRVRLRLRTEAAADDGVAFAFPLWGSPEILQRTARGDQRNLILISLDTWRADYFETDVGGGPVTPRLARWAQRGAVFEQALATYPSTSASHMSLLTGLYPIHHQVRFANDVLGDSVPTLAEILAAHGYQTGAITENAMLLAEAGFAFGFDSYFENKGLGLWSTEGQIDSTLARGRRWLEENGARRFFLFLHTYQIHTPYEPPAEFYVAPNPEDPTPSTEPDWVRTLRHQYAGEIRYADHALAAFLDELDASGLARNSIVVLTSDHGEEFLEHGQMGHSKSVYDEVLRVPLLVRAPGLVRPHTRIRSPVSLVDVAPTLLELLGLRTDGTLQGQSLAASLRGDAPPPSTVRFAEGPDVRRDGHRSIAVRTERYKWITPEDGDQPTEIYDLERDPGETRPLDDEALRQTGAAHLAAYRRLAGTGATRRELDARTTEKLKALGYLE